MVYDKEYMIQKGPPSRKATPGRKDRSVVRYKVEESDKRYRNDALNDAFDEEEGLAGMVSRRMLSKIKD